MNSPMIDQEGYSIVEMLVVVMLIGIVAAYAVPQYMMAYDRAKQRGTMADMRLIAERNAAYRVDAASYADALGDLVPNYIQVVPTRDRWDNDFDYTGGTDYTLTSYGADGSAGPDPPSDWQDEPYEGDLIMENGHFTQAPVSTGQ